MQNKIERITTLAEFHRRRGLPQPLHPLISVIDYRAIKPSLVECNTPISFDFYSISLKRGLSGTIIYGQKEYDYNEGVMFFIAPKQVFKIEVNTNPAEERSGWMLLIHPDLILNTPLAATIQQFDFFGYAVNEALFLSESEETTINTIIKNIQQEYESNCDNFSQSIVISQIETMLQYAERFYNRQFITRKKSNHEILDRLEKLLADCFDEKNLLVKGLPTVQFVSSKLNTSPNYLRGLLKIITGRNTQEHIHDKLIGKAKEKIVGSKLSISEIAYELGFEHPQSFSKLFKKKTNLSPIEFRQSFEKSLKL